MNSSELTSRFEFTVTRRQFRDEFNVDERVIMVEQPKSNPDPVAKTYSTTKTRQIIEKLKDISGHTKRKTKRATEKQAEIEAEIERKKYEAIIAHCNSGLKGDSEEKGRTELVKEIAILASSHKPDISNIFIRSCRTTLGQCYATAWEGGDDSGNELQEGNPVNDHYLALASLLWSIFLFGLTPTPDNDATTAAPPS